MRETTELDGSWLNRRCRPHGYLNSWLINDGRCFVVVVCIVISVEGSVMIVMRRNHMMIFIMVARYVVSMRIDDHMVLVP